MVPPFVDLDLSQAQAFALEPHDLAQLLATVEDSLTHSLGQLQTPLEPLALRRTLHDLKGYLGLVASSGLTDLVSQADQAAREGAWEPAQALIPVLMPRLVVLQARLRAYQAGIIDD